MRDPEGRVVHAKMKLGNGVILMGSPGKDYICPKRLGHVTQNLSWSFLGAVSWRNFRGGAPKHLASRGREADSRPPESTRPL